MDRLSKDQLKRIAYLVANRNLTPMELDSRAHSITGCLDLAQRAVDWLPEAFGLVAISRMDGLDLPTTFTAKDSDGTWHQFPLSAEPIYVQATDLAYDPEVPFREIAAQSSCIHAVNNALNSGAPLDGARISGPALVRLGAEMYMAANNPL